MGIKGLDFLKITSETGEEAHCICPFHDDHRASLSVNTSKKKWNCFACQKGSGSLEELRLTYSAMKHNRKLLSDKETMAGLASRLITSDHVKKYSLGLSKMTEGDRLTIPYFRGNDIVYGMKYHLLDKKSSDPKVVVEGKVPDLFPKWDFDNNKKEVYLVEGELDCIVARDIFGRSVCTFGPVNYFNKSYLKNFKDKIVTIILDNDKPGIEGANSYTSKIQPIAKEVRRCVLLDQQGQPVKDITDYLNKYSADKLKRIIEKAPIYKIEKDSRIIEIRADYSEVEKEETSFKDSLKSSNYGKLMTVSGLISGKDTEPFIVPIEATIFCTSTKKSKTCSNCPLKDDVVKLRISKLSRNIIQLILASDSQVRHILRTMINAPQCPEIEIKNTKMVNIEELRIAPKSPEERHHGYTTRRVFKVDQDFTETNIPYKFRGIVVPDPRLQYAVLISDDAQKDKHDIDLFHIVPEEITELKDFISKAGKFEGLIKIVEKISGIYFRETLCGVILLTFLSVLKFNLFNKVRRGYIASLIIGDTRTGKTELITNFIEAVKLGEVISGKITSRAGIVGGVKQINGRFIISWGKIVINNQGFLGIDEGQGMTPEDYTMLTNIRSSGIAEIVKIEHEKVKAETRFLVLANPRDPDKMMKDFSYGVYAIKDLIGKPEDIARFDLFAGVTIDSIDKHKLYEAMELGPTAKEKEVNLLRKLILFAWTRLAGDIKISKETIQCLKQEALKFDYSPNIPLVERNEAMYKIFRISIAMAVANGNFNTKGQVNVKSSDIRNAKDFMIRCFEDPALKYGEFSSTFKMKGIRDPEALKKKLQYLGVEFLEGMLSTPQVTLGDLGDYAGLSERTEIKSLASDLVRARALRKNYTFYEKSSEFIKLLRKVLYEMQKGGNK